MVTIVQALAKCVEQRTPFVAYSKPNEDQLHIWSQKTSKTYIVEDYKESGFVFAPFDALNKTFYIPFSESIYQSFKLQEISSNQEYANDELPLQENRRAQHLALVSKGIQAIKQDGLKKVVLSRKHTLPPIKSTITVFQRLLQQYPQAFVYFWFHPVTGIWMGASPEALVLLKDNHLQTMSLAGTQVYEGTSEVSWGSKENTEQQFVTDEIVKQLEPLISGLSIGNQHTVRAGNVLHLCTKIEGRLLKTNVKALLERLHPTPAICGLPRALAHQFIKNEEGYDRSYYTGFLGELNLRKVNRRSRNSKNIEQQAYFNSKKETNLFVNLRCMQVSEKETTLYVGGGITGASIPEAEWVETVKKAETLSKLL